MDHITAIAQMLTEVICQTLPPEYTLSDIEQVSHQLIKKIGRQAKEAVVNEQEKPYPELTATCPQCGQTSPYVR